MVKKEISQKKQSKKFIPVLDKDTPKEMKVNPKFKVDREGGWKEKKPHTKKERKELFEKCGDDAFLLPKHLKFPICNKITVKNHQCTYNCMGLKGSSSRAGEWGYKNVLKNSKKLTSELGCYSDPSKNIKKPNENKRKKEEKTELKKEKKTELKKEKKTELKSKKPKEKESIFTTIIKMF